jgi:hypothetical protein
MRNYACPQFKKLPEAAAAGLVGKEGTGTGLLWPCSPGGSLPAVPCTPASPSPWPQRAGSHGGCSGSPCQEDGQDDAEERSWSFGFSERI